MDGHAAARRLVRLSGLLALLLHVPYVVQFSWKGLIGAPRAGGLWLLLLPYIASLGAAVALAASRRWRSRIAHVVAACSGMPVLAVGVVILLTVEAQVAAAYTLGFLDGPAVLWLGVFTVVAGAGLVVAGIGTATNRVPEIRFHRSLERLPLAVPIGLGIASLFVPVAPVAWFATHLLIGGSVSVIAVIVVVQVWRGFGGSSLHRAALALEGVGGALLVVGLTFPGGFCGPGHIPETRPTTRVTYSVADDVLYVPLRGTEYAGCTTSPAWDLITVGVLLLVTTSFALLYVHRRNPRP